MLPGQQCVSCHVCLGKLGDDYQHADADWCHALRGFSDRTHELQRSLCTAATCLSSSSACALQQLGFKFILLSTNALYSHTAPDVLPKGSDSLQASNVCVGADGRVYLSDLGAAKKLRVRLSACHDFGSIVRLSTFVGSPAAMAPVRSHLSQSVTVVHLTLGGCLAWMILWIRFCLAARLVTEKC